MIVIDVCSKGSKVVCSEVDSRWLHKRLRKKLRGKRKSLSGAVAATHLFFDDEDEVKAGFLDPPDSLFREHTPEQANNEVCGTGCETSIDDTECAGNELLAGSEVVQEMSLGERNAEHCVVDNKSLVTVKRKRNKKKANYGKMLERLDLPDWVRNDHAMLKYWLQRYRLFSRWDEGIQLDRGELSQCLHLVLGNLF